jgi:hypothetical protein
VPSRLRSVGVTGAAVLLVGVVLVGSSFAIDGLALSTETTCGTSCQHSFEAAENETVWAQFLLGFGFCVAAAGAALVLAATVQFMATPPSDGSEGSPRSGDSGTDPGAGSGSVAKDASP